MNISTHYLSEAIAKLKVFFAAFVLLSMNFIRIDTVLSWVQLKSLTT